MYKANKRRISQIKQHVKQNLTSSTESSEEESNRALSKVMLKFIYINKNGIFVIYIYIFLLYIFKGNYSRIFFIQRKRTQLNTNTEASLHYTMRLRKRHKVETTPNEVSYRDETKLQ